MTSNPLLLDPTRTQTLRRTHAATIRGRFRAFQQGLRIRVATSDVLGLGASSHRWRDVAARIGDLLIWVDYALGRGPLSPAFFEMLVNSGFRKGAERGYADSVKRSKVASRRQPDFWRGAEEQFQRTLLSQPDTGDLLRLLRQRMMGNLRGLMETIIAAVTRISTESILQSHRGKWAAWRLSEAMSSYSARAILLAQDEFLRAHAEGYLSALGLQGGQGVTTAVEWKVGDTSRLCERCRAFSRQPFTLKQARGVLPHHPGCRCTWKIV